jgi:hypothetical protein
LADCEPVSIRAAALIFFGTIPSVVNRPLHSKRPARGQSEMAI